MNKKISNFWLNLIINIGYGFAIWAILHCINMSEWNRALMSLLGWLTKTLTESKFDYFEEQIDSLNKRLDSYEKG